MSRMPGAIWQPLAANWADMPKMRAWDIFCVHTMVGGLEGTDNYFRVVNGPGFVGTESHFGTGYDGTIIQWQDTDYQADANYHGAWHVISVENADTGTGFPKWSGSDVPALTDAQVEANARIAAWLHTEHGIPLDTIPDAKPGRRGLGSHRLGIPGYMAVGAELWSKSGGKACPGDRRVAQLPAISARAKQIAAGNPPEEDMPLTDDDVARIAKQVRLELRDADPVYGLAAFKRRFDSLDIAVRTADANDSGEALAAAVIAALPTGRDGSLTVSDVEAAVRGVFGDAAA